MDGHGDNTTVIGNSSCSSWHPGATNKCDIGSSTYKFKDIPLNGTAFINTIDASQLNFTNLPTTNPNIAGRLWKDSGTLKISS